MDLESRQFDEYAQKLAHRGGRWLALFLACFGVLRLPFFGGAAAWGSVESRMRLCIVALQLLAFALMYTRLGARRPIATLASLGLLVMGIGAAGSGLVGDARDPSIYTSFPSLCISVIVPIGLRARGVLVIAATLVTLGGFYLVQPWQQPGTLPLLSFAFVSAVIMIAVGHVAFRALRHSFSLRRLTDHLERAREEERTRIARELHDQLGQELTALRLSLDLASRRFARDPESIEGNLGEMGALLERTQKSVRSLVTELRPALLDERGLAAGVEELVAQAEARAGLSCRCDLDALGELPADIATIAYRVVQEALTNVVRHARARHVEVRLARAPAQLEIAVSDDGVGIAEGKGGLGLLGMRERVALHAGVLSLGPRPGGGTRLAVTLPLTVGA